MKKIFKAAFIFIILSFSAIALSACQPTSNNSNNNDQTSNNESEEVSDNAVSIKNMAFTPSTLNVKVGDTVTWTNNDSFAHTVTSDDGDFDSSTFSKGKTFSFTFTKEGTFSYHCELHTSMKGKVIVSAN